ncbi:hypothetical protein BST27_18140 [Mycobacterium intermedium]|uniref:DUF732 domain-containing protein n=1 Tax=Mycobacterium intermedium TaxID=28445 RepID=A0A1E3SBA4_MYCIE|nr:DUF732 domain-containing protein [Mycobacterium intermedium]MCV6962310.1 DUF732 domain-containing protein [Mycobacterium intermedium]ODQ99399.1 hypothetical protein BHQ20_17970 [Mycobacterium intermedium]OPE51172.1 hypothetical protein BV508_07605 [Mycobacterium intermedium]ORB00888.1 hypothetical protein BST27_18140 [Mycobacterium intermedium]
MSIDRVRTPMPARSLRLGLVVLVSLLGLVAPTAPTARADGIDDEFLSAVKSRDIKFASPQSAILAGHQVCNELDQGRPKADVATDLANSGRLDGYHAGFFVGLSIAAFCPRHHG